ncbi:hypothetical protein L873DRAFT_1811499 [Choiromyces venosus 120613-1]|uniref:Uncharacterized protein n=1 Tax=Choiromyces venosus 120613-1 TaxID=1336337 RepID=A0A3N4JRC2_9PEZI|nr:hypothetical protein L873DRAFT_1811499 [Choiromyces venosus 120613-1]
MSGGLNKKHDLQIQAGRESWVSSIAMLAPDTVAGPELIEVEDEVTPQEVRDMFLGKMLV